MNEREQITVLNNILVAIAPRIAQQALDKLSLTLDPYRDNPAEGYSEVRREIFEEHAQIAVELASHLAAKFALVSDAALAPETQEAPTKSQQGPPKSIADILSQPSGVSSEALKLRAMRAAQQRGPS